MSAFILAIFLAFSCPNHTHSGHHPSTQTSTPDDTGGDTGHIPPNPDQP